MDKSPDAFRTISEVAELLETPAHVLRFWESRFPQIKPVKRAGGRRYYRPADMALLAGIRKLLHDEGMTIRGVQKVLREQGVRYVSGLTEDYAFEDTDTEEIVLPAVPVKSSAPIPLFPPRDDTAAEPNLPTPELTEPAPVVAESIAASAESQLETSAAETTAKAPTEPEEPAVTEEVPTAAPEAAVPPVDAPQPDAIAPKQPAPPEPAPAPKPAAAVVPAKAPVKKPLPAAFPPSTDIRVDGLAAELRKLHQGAFGANHAQALALSVQLQALRDRVNDLGRSPRR